MSEPLRAPAPEPQAGAGDDVPSRRAREQAEAAAAVDAVMAREREKAERRVASETRVRREPPYKLLLLLALVAFNVDVWLTQPRWLRFEPPPLAYPTQYYEGGWKLAVYLQRQRVENYRRAHGSLPLSASAAGPPVPGVAYTPEAPARYQLAAGAGPGRVVYDSGDSLLVAVGRTLLQMGLVTVRPR